MRFVLSIFALFCAQLVSASIPRPSAALTNSQVNQVGGSNTIVYAARGFNAQGQLLGVNFGNGVITTNDYYANSKRPKGIATAKPGSANIQNLGYTYDKVSNLKGIADFVYTTNASAALTNLVYDDLHRLTSLTRPAISQTTTFSFSSIGNLTINGEAGAGTYNYGSRMPHAVKSANGKNYAYDGNGNMLVRGNQRLDYDPENRLSLVTSTNSTTTFGYADGGARLWKQRSGTNGLQIWIGENYEEKNGQILFHVLAGGKSVCTFDSTGTNVFEYYHSDHLRSTSVLTDKNGNRIQHHEYSAFGRDRFTESATAFSLSRRYTSQVLDEDTGLYFYGARYYDPELARFIQADDIISDLDNPQTYNRYSYALNNPLRYIDPTGHEAEEDDDVPLTPGGQRAALAREDSNAAALQRSSRQALKTTAAIARTAVELNPVVGAFNSGYGAVQGQDAISGEKLSTSQRVLSGVSAAASGEPVVLKAGQVVKGAATVAKEGLVAAKTTPKLLNPGINVTEQGMQHVLERHIVNGIPEFAGKSKFTTGVNLQELIQQGTQMPMVRQANGNFARTFDAGRAIGVNRATGQASSTVTIITGSNGNLVTMFPGAP